MAKDNGTGRKQLERHPLSQEYPDIAGAAWEKLVANLKDLGIVGGRKITLHEGKVLDGWQLYRACLEADVDPEFEPLPDWVSAEEFVATVNDHRRHETQEIAMRRAAGRVKRVAELREGGDSLRTIADKERVSVAQVRNDLAAASTVQGCTVEPKNGTVTGKDGRVRPARREPTPGAARDARRQAEAGEASPPTPDDPQRHPADREPGDDTDSEAASRKADRTAPKNGRETFDWRDFDRHLGPVMQGPDRIAQAYPAEKQSDDFHLCSEILDTFAAAWTTWKKRLTRGR